MCHFDIQASAFAILCACASVCFAQSMSEAEYARQRNVIDTELRDALGNCAQLTGNATIVCSAEAKGRRSVAAAALELQYNGNHTNHHRLALSHADAEHAVAQAKCLEAISAAKSACQMQAREMQMSARANARASFGVAKALAAAPSGPGPGADQSGR